MQKVNLLDYDAAQAQKRAYVATLMDDNPDHFAAPQGGGTWGELIASGAALEGHHREVIDQAQGMLASLIRSAQMSMEVTSSMADLFERAGLENSPDYQPDPAAMAMAAPDEDPRERTAFAQAITIYKQCADEGMVERDDFPRFIEDALDQQPGSSALTRSLIETAKHIVRLDLDLLLAPQPEPEPQP